MGNPYTYRSETITIASRQEPWQELTDPDFSACRSAPTACCVPGEKILDFAAIETGIDRARFFRSARELQDLVRTHHQERLKLRASSVVRNYGSLLIVEGAAAILGAVGLFAHKLGIPFGRRFRIPFFIIAEAIAGLAGSYTFISRREVLAQIHRLDQALLRDYRASAYSQLPRTAEVCP